MILVAVLAVLAFAPAAGRGRTGRGVPPASGPEQTLVQALEAACSQDPQRFSPYLLADSRRALAALPVETQKTFLRRITLTSLAGQGHALLDVNNRLVVRCDTPAESVTFRLGKPEIDGNVAFVSVTVAGTPPTRFGLVRQPGGWRLLSLGLLVIDVPALAQQWAEAEMRGNELEAAADLRALEKAIKTYHTAFGQWPETLSELGPAPPNEVSPQHAQLITASLGAGAADGYLFRYRLVTGADGAIEGFELGAVPQKYAKTGRQSFFLDGEGKLHAADKRDGPATASDPIYTPPRPAEP